MTQDPIGDGDNWYAYADNSPTNAIDPGGMKMIPLGDGSETDDGSGDSPETNPATGATFTPEPVSVTITSPDHYSTGTTSITGGNIGTTDAGMGLGGFVDANITFGTVAMTGRAWGAVDSGHGSRVAAIGATALVGLSVAAFIESRGEDAVGVNVTEKGTCYTGRTSRDFRRRRGQ